MPANLENSAVATGLEKVSFHSSPKEGQCQRMLKLLHNWAHVTASKVMLKMASTIHALRNSRYTSWVSKRQRNQSSQCQHSLDYGESKGVPEKTYTSASLMTQKPLNEITANWEILKEMGILDHFTWLPSCLSW